MSSILTNFTDDIRQFALKIQNIKKINYDHVAYLVSENILGKADAAR